MSVDGDEMGGRQASSSSPSGACRRSVSPAADIVGDDAASPCRSESHYGLFTHTEGHSRTLGDSIKAAASSAFPAAVERIVRESRSVSRARSNSVAASMSNPQPLAGDGRSTPSEDARSTASATGMSNLVGGLVGDSFTGSSSFASSAAQATTQRPPQSQELSTNRNRSFISALFESKPKKVVSVGASALMIPDVTDSSQSRFPVTSSGPSSQGILSATPELPRKCYRSKVSIIGCSGSGKSTFQHCFSHSMIKTLPEVPPSISFSNSWFYFKSQTKREKLDVLVVDSGPLPFSSGSITPVYHDTNLFLLCISLSGIKQRSNAKRFFPSFGSSQPSEPPVIIHAQDRRIIRHFLTKISATADAKSVSLKRPQFALIGTHMDHLSDSSREAVELVLKELNHIVVAVARELPEAPMLLGCFAVSCTDHSCIPENRGGPKSINELWHFLCDILLKEATHTRALATVEPQIVLEDIRRWMGGESPVVAADIPLVAAATGATGATATTASQGASQLESAATAVGGSNGEDILPMNDVSQQHADIRLITDRVTCFIRRAKTELNFVVVHYESLAQVACSLGVYCSAHLDAVLHHLARDGEISLFLNQPRHIHGRENAVVLWPNLADRAAVTMARYQHSSQFPVSERGRLLPGIDIHACLKYDQPEALFGTGSAGGSAPSRHGVFSPKLMVCLSNCLPLSRRTIVERAETFAVLLLLNDYAFQRRKPITPRPAGSEPESTAEFSASATEDDDDSVHISEPGGGTTTSAVLNSPVRTVSTPPPAAVTARLPAFLSPSPRIRHADDMSDTAEAALSPQTSVIFVAPSLIPDVVGPSVVELFETQLPLCQVQHRGLLLDQHPAFLICRTVCFPLSAPPDVFPLALCRLAPYLFPGSKLFSDAAWIAPWDSSDAMMRCFVRLTEHHTTVAPSPSSSSSQHTHHNSHHQRPTVKHLPAAEIRFTFLSSGKSLATAAWVLDVLGVVCSALESKFCGLEWSIADGSQWGFDTSTAAHLHNKATSEILNDCAKQCDVSAVSSSPMKLTLADLDALFSETTAV